MPYDILIAEDNLVNQKLAVKILEKYGHRVEIAENGQLAVDAFRTRVQRNQPFDIILVRGFRVEVSSHLLIIACAIDGCFHALHGWYGGHGVDSCIRDFTWPGPCAYHRINSSC